MKKDTYILITKDKFQITCDGYELYLALKLLFSTLQKNNPEYFKVLKKLLIEGRETT